MKPSPHDHEAEAAVLAGVMLHDTIPPDLATLRAEDFDHPAHRAIWAAMSTLAERRQPIDPVTLEARLRATDQLGLVGGLEGLGKLSDRYASSHRVHHHAQIVADVARRRRVVHACRLVADQGTEAVEDEQAWHEAAERQILEAGARADHSGHQRAPDVVAATMGALRERMGRRDYVIGVPSGIETLDRMIGGFQPGKLYVIAGRPGHGKSALAGNVAHWAGVHGRNGRTWPSLTINLEMGPTEVMERHLWCQIQGMEHRPGIHDRVRAGQATQDDWRIMVQAADALHQSPISIDDGVGMGTQEIVASARQWRHGPDCGRDREAELIVDYLQLIRPPQGKSTYNREQEVAAISREMKILAKELHLPVLLLCQLNRGVENREDHRPRLSDLRESGAIEQDADVIAFVHRPPLYLPAGSPERKAAAEDAEVIVAKQRGGETGVIPCRYLGPYLTFLDSPERAP